MNDEKEEEEAQGSDDDDWDMDDVPALEPRGASPPQSKEVEVVADEKAQSEMPGADDSDALVNVNEQDNAVSAINFHPQATGYDAINASSEEEDAEVEGVENVADPNVPEEPSSAVFNGSDENQGAAMPNENEDFGLF